MDISSFTDSTRQELDSIIEITRKKLDTELQEMFSEIINEENIPILPPERRNEDYIITIYVTPEPLTKTTKKNRSAKNVLQKLAVRFCTMPEFDIQKLHDSGKLAGSIELIWNILKTEYVLPTKKKLYSWSRAFFTPVSKMYKEQFGLTLTMLPFEVSLDKENNLYISKLPTFCDLWFLDENHKNNKNNYKNRFDNNAFLERQARSIIKLTSDTNLFYKA